MYRLKYLPRTLAHWIYASKAVPKSTILLVSWFYAKAALHTFTRHVWRRSTPTCNRSEIERKDCSEYRSPLVSDRTLKLIGMEERHDTFLSPSCVSAAFKNPLKTVHKSSLTSPRRPLPADMISWRKQAFDGPRARTLSTSTGIWFEP